MFRLSVNVNRSGKAMSNPDAPGILPQDQNAEEYAGVAFLVTPSGELVNPSEVRTQLSQSSIWMMACSVTPGEAVLCRVEAVYQLINMSDAFQLKSGRSGVSAQVVLLSRPGQARSEYALLNSSSTSVLNVHFDDYQAVLNSTYLFRPAFDKLGEGGALTPSWETGIPEVTADVYMEGQLLWTNPAGGTRAVTVMRSPLTSSFRRIQQGDLLTQVYNCRDGATVFSTVLHFELPCGFKFTEVPSQEPDPNQYKKLLWPCWYKVYDSGAADNNLLTFGVADWANLSDINIFNPMDRVDDASLLFPIAFSDF